MATKDKKGNWIDSTGQPIPPKYIKPLEKSRDGLVDRLHKKALEVRGKLSKLRAEIDREVEKHLAELEKETGEGLNPCGNYVFTGFSGDKRVQIKTSALLEFDERLQAAKQKIDRCLDRWAKGGNENLRLIVFDAFRVDQKGRVDTRRILGLRRHKITDDEWNAAMDLISEAVTVTGRKTYILFQTRPAPDKEWETLRLDLAGTEVA